MARSEKATKFLEEIVILGKSYGLSLAHEDIGGAFFVEPYNKEAEDWLMEAYEEKN
jgi:hypothetical protein